MDWVVSGLSQGDWQETSLGPVCMGSACEAWVLSSRFLSIHYSFFWMGRLLAGCIMLHVLILPCSLQLCMTSWFFLEHLNCDLLNFRVQEEQKKEPQIDLKKKNYSKRTEKKTKQTLRAVCPAIVMFSLSFCVFVARQDCEALETETKRFEDLEFQQLECESRQDEEKETHTQQLLRDIADYQRSTVTRKVRVEVERFSSGGSRPKSGPRLRGSFFS